ncbi:MAG TPA: universal stress protein [Chitinophagales bacterium]|nr:universal stress protein [Chitinophagales bacterium]
MTVKLNVKFWINFAAAMANPEKRILVPTDFSQPSYAALQYAIYIANRTDSRISLIHFADRAELKEKGGSIAGYKEVLRALDQQLQDMKNASGAAFRMHAEVISTTQSIADEISDYGLKIDAVMACLGTAGKSARKSSHSLGDNTGKLVKSVDFPVLTCRNVKEPIRFRNFLLPIDLTKYTTEKVERIIRFAQGFEATIHLVAVSEFLEEYFTSREALGEKMEEAAETIRKSGLKCTTEMIRHDMVNNSIKIYASEIDADLLVIMSHGENKFNQLIFGSRINKVISHSDIPVLSFRPEDD